MRPPPAVQGSPSRQWLLRSVAGAQGRGGGFGVKGEYPNQYVVVPSLCCNHCKSFPSEEEVQMGEMIFKIEDIVFLPEYILEDEDLSDSEGQSKNDELNTAFYESDSEDTEWSISSIQKENSFYLNDLEIELNA